MGVGDRRCTVTTWAAQVTAQIDGVRAEIAELTTWAYRTDMPDASRELMLAPWRRWLAAPEGDEMAAARAADAGGVR